MDPVREPLHVFEQEGFWPYVPENTQVPANSLGGNWIIKRSRLLCSIKPALRESRAWRPADKQINLSRSDTRRLQESASRYSPDSSDNKGNVTEVQLVGLCTSGLSISRYCNLESSPLDA
jgi:hypothetical protein